MKNFRTFDDDDEYRNRDANKKTNSAYKLNISMLSEI